MTIGEQLRLICDGLRKWTDDLKGTVTIAEDVSELISKLTTAPGSPRVIVMFDSEEKRGDYEELGKVDRKFLVIVSRGRSMRIQDGLSVLEGSAGGKPFYDLMEEGRESVRRLRFDRETTDGLPNYLRTGRVLIDGYVTDGRQIEFSIGTQLPSTEEPEVPEE